MGYKFIKTVELDNPFDNVEVNIHLTGGSHSLPAVLEVVRDFLRACGYQCDSLEQVSTEGDDI